MAVTLHVCVTCRAGQPFVEGEPVPGAKLHRAILGEPIPSSIQVVPVECLSACNYGCSVALSGDGRWSYVYGQLSEADAATIIDGAVRYAATADGIVPWRERPEIFRKNSLARIPPVSPLKEAAE
jgi:predicted metal-binding protein